MGKVFTGVAAVWLVVLNAVVIWHDSFSKNVNTALYTDLAIVACVWFLLGFWHLLEGL